MREKNPKIGLGRRDYDLLALFRDDYKTLLLV